MSIGVSTEAGLLTAYPPFSPFSKFIRHAPKAIQEVTDREEGLWIQPDRRAPSEPPFDTARIAQRPFDVFGDRLL